MSGDHNMHQKPKALRLADDIESQAISGIEKEVAHADCTLIAEIIRLKKELHHYMMAATAEAELVDELRKENEALRADSEMLRKIAFLLKGQNRFSGGYDSMVAQALERIDADEALLRQALEALEMYRRRLLVEAGCRCDNGDNIIAAIKEHLK